MSTPQELNPFSAFRLDDFLYVLAAETGITVVDGEDVASQPASTAKVVVDGHIKNVPENWTMSEMAMKLIASRLGSAEVQVAIAKAASHRAHVAQALATAESARVAALKQQLEDESAAAATAGLNIDDTILRAQEAQAAAQVAIDEAIDAITAIPPGDVKKTYVATLAPEFAHLAGEMEEGDGQHAPKPSFSGVPRDIVGFCCTGCKTYNLVRGGGKDWYAVYVGKAVGVFYGSRRAEAVTSGVSRASFKRFFTIDDATEAFAKALISRTVNIVPPPVVL